MIAVVRFIISVFMSLVCVFSSNIIGNIKTDFSPVSEENCNLFFSAISDIHMQESSVRKTTVKLGMDDMERAETELDALVFCGDNTDHGYVEQYEALCDALSGYKPAKTLILAEGNHDTWTEKEGYNEARNLMIDYTKKITGRDIDNVYYSVEVNGYTFIVLGSEIDKTYAYISDEQIEWLQNEMEKASKKGLPIFVISHWPINGTHGLPQSWGDKEYDAETGGFGAQSDRIEEVLKQYENVFLISGHIHTGVINEKMSKLYGYCSVESDGSFHSVNLPCYMYPAVRGTMFNGTGFVFEVYDNTVIIRTRSFVGGVWFPDDVFVIPLV